jgi:hypothetical protein
MNEGIKAVNQKPPSDATTHGSTPPMAAVSLRWRRLQFGIRIRHRRLSKVVASVESSCALM